MKLDTPAAVPAAAAPGDQSRPALPPPSLDSLNVPSSSIIIVCREVGEALKLVPKSIVLSVEEYQKLLDQIEQLRRQNKPEKPQSPSTCRISGRVVDDIAHLHASFDFRTNRPNSIVGLGCQKGWPTDARLDGDLAWVGVGEDGYLLQVEKPGAHVAKLEMRIPVTTRRGFKGAGRGFDLDLPAAPIVTLDQFDLPGAPPEVLVGGRSIRPTAIDAQHARLDSVPIVPANPAEPTRRLDLVWKGPAAEPAKGPTVRSALAKIVVHLNETRVATDAELELKVERGDAAQWRILVPAPPDAIQEVKVQLPEDEPRIEGIERSADKNGTLLTVRLKEPIAGSLKLLVRFQQAQAGAPIPIGPLAVLDVMGQRGLIEVHSSDELRLHYQKQSSVGQREVTEEQRRDNVRAAFQYWNVPARPGEPFTPWLTVQAEHVKGNVEVRVSQDLRLLKGNSGATPKFRLTTRLDVTPIRTAVDRMELSLPADYQYESAVGPSPTEIVEDIKIDAQTRTVQVKLAHKQARPFSVTIPGSLSVRAGQQDGAFALPVPLTWSVERGVQMEDPAPASLRVPFLDRGGQVTVSLPEDLQAVGNPAAQENGSPKLRELALQTAGAREYAWQGERLPVKVTLAWRPFHADLTAHALVDLTLSGAQAHVRELLDLHFSQTPASRIVLRVPPGLLGSIRVLEGGNLADPGTGLQGDCAVALKNATEREHHLLLEYAFALPEPPVDVEQPGDEVREQPDHDLDRPRPNTTIHFPVPLIRIRDATRGNTKIRVWSDPGNRLRASGGQWEELAPDIVAERDSLPAMVLRGGLETPLLLHRNTSSNSVLATAVIERALIRCLVQPGGMQMYQARFRLAGLNTRALDIQLPVAPAAASMEVLLDDRSVPYCVLDDASNENRLGRILRLQVEPRLYRKSAILKISFPLDPTLQGRDTLFEATLQPPVILGAIVLGRVRWAVELPPGDMALYAGSGYTAEVRWGWWGAVLFPGPAVTAQELEQWFTESGTAAASKDAEPALVCWQSTLTPLVLMHAPVRLWLLLCSLTFLGVGVGLLYLPLGRLLFWFCVLLLGGLATAVGIVWPFVLSNVVYGSELGAVFLLLVAVFQWTLHERYRRKVVFMPGFTRLKPGSSLIRPGSSSRKRDVSTVDEPAKRGSSLSSEPKA